MKGLLLPLVVALLLPVDGLARQDNAGSNFDGQPQRGSRPAIWKLEIDGADYQQLKSDPLARRTWKADVGELYVGRVNGVRLTVKDVVAIHDSNQLPTGAGFEGSPSFGEPNRIYFNETHLDQLMDGRADFGVAIPEAYRNVRKYEIIYRPSRAFTLANTPANDRGFDPSAGSGDSSRGSLDNTRAGFANETSRRDPLFNSQQYQSNMFVGPRLPENQRRSVVDNSANWQRPTSPVGNEPNTTWPDRRQVQPDLNRFSVDSGTQGGGFQRPARDNPISGRDSLAPIRSNQGFRPLGSDPNSMVTNSGRDQNLGATPSEDPALAMLRQQQEQLKARNRILEDERREQQQQLELQRIQDENMALQREVAQKEYELKQRQAQFSRTGSVMGGGYDGAFSPHSTRPSQSITSTRGQLTGLDNDYRRSNILDRPSLDITPPSNRVASLDQTPKNAFDPSMTPVKPAERTSSAAGNPKTPTSSAAGNAEAERKHDAQTSFLLLLFLLCSIGLNFYLAWVSRGFYLRYNDLADELRDTFNATSV